MFIYWRLPSSLEDFSVFFWGLLSSSYPGISSLSWKFSCQMEFLSPLSLFSLCWFTPSSWWSTWIGSFLRNSEWIVRLLRFCLSTSVFILSVDWYFEDTEFGLGINFPQDFEALADCVVFSVNCPYILKYPCFFFFSQCIGTRGTI